MKTIHKRKAITKKRYNKKMKMQSRSSEDIFREYAKDIITSQNFIKSGDHIQHGSMTVSEHCINVALHSIALSKKLGIQCNYRDLVRGALLHDYFLYDWHDKNRVNIKKLHGFYHPGIALKNAQNEYLLTEREKDIIRKHMWPLTVIPPRCREAWIVTTADKYCSLLETLRMHRGSGRRNRNQKRKPKVQYQG